LVGEGRQDWSCIGGKRTCGEGEKQRKFAAACTVVRAPELELTRAVIGGAGSWYLWRWLALIPIRPIAFGLSEQQLRAGLGPEEGDDGSGTGGRVRKDNSHDSGTVQVGY
jgi:hypothetical protein